MKKSFLVMFILSFLVIFKTYSQIENIKIKNDSSVVINNAYIGLLNTSAFQANKGEMTSENFYSFRVGAMVTWQTFSFMKVKTFAVYNNADGNGSAINSASVKFHTNKERLGLELGKMSTLATESRPLPPTAGGHFETWTESMIPGSAFGLKATYKFSGFMDGCMIGAGVGQRENRPEYHLRFSSRVFDVSTYYTVSSGRKGVASVLKLERLYSVFVYENIGESNLVANFSNFNISKKIKLDCYLDFGYEFKSEDVRRLEFGIIKNFSSDLFKGLVALGYQYENRSLNAYLFFHI